ncbi:MAG: hypothetical protein Q9179_005793 [Wetmoreana sp. 5 TL-2023]
MENPSPSALTSFIEASKPGGDSSGQSHHQALAAQVLHNLQYQHDWTELRIHIQSRIPGIQLPKSLVSGLPPHRIYVHPDEQIGMLKHNIQEKDVPLEREWVLPTHLQERWSLRKFAEVFDGINEIPSAVGQDGEGRRTDSTGVEGLRNKRGGKRLLLATVGDDSTIVYYVVHDGIVKPRQN